MAPTNDYKALNYAEIRGVWISYLEFASMSSSTESAFRSSISEVFDNCVDFGINTVYVHARSHGDAYYSSSLFPRTKYLGGSYDPLKIAIEEAHKRNLSIHAWINPLRACSSADAGREGGYKIGSWIGGGTRAVLVNGYYYLNPAYDEVIRLIADGVVEIAANYDVDGIHIDDYFYPTTDASFDAEAYGASGYSSLSDFRFANCDKFVSSIYEALKSVNKSMLFSVSCQGNVNNNYSAMYADVKKWCSQPGYLDIIMPQVYFGFNNSSQPYEKCCAEWNAIARSGNVPLVIGVSASKIGLEDTYAGASGKLEWITDSDILVRQYLSARELEYYSGICLYSYNSLFKPSSSVSERVGSEKEALKNAFEKNGDI
ncbi:MAG: family 10 glycosylhydrolase [Oscillospiraceae bacterium]|nr:family 10 glycosylhydrolase [Oscillospiraceae bacterium]